VKKKIGTIIEIFLLCLHVLYLLTLFFGLGTLSIYITIHYNFGWHSPLLWLPCFSLPFVILIIYLVPDTRPKEKTFKKCIMQKGVTVLIFIPNILDALIDYVDLWSYGVKNDKA